MAHRLDVLMRAKALKNAELARKIGYSTNYISGVRNGDRPGMKLAEALCRYFEGELTLSDLGIEIDPSMLTLSDRKGAA